MREGGRGEGGEEGEGGEGGKEVSIYIFEILV